MQLISKEDTSTCEGISIFFYDFLHVLMLLYWCSVIYLEEESVSRQAGEVVPLAAPPEWQHASHLFTHSLCSHGFLTFFSLSVSATF